MTGARGRGLAAPPALGFRNYPLYNTFGMSDTSSGTLPFVDFMYGTMDEAFMYEVPGGNAKRR